MSAVLQRPIRYRRVPGEAYKDRMTQFGMSDAMAQGMLDMALAKDAGPDNGVLRTPAGQHARHVPPVGRGRARAGRPHLSSQEHQWCGPPARTTPPDAASQPPFGPGMISCLSSTTQAIPGG
jgi:hypothetical protein